MSNPYPECYNALDIDSAFFEGIDEMTSWTLPKHTASQVNRAGKIFHTEPDLVSRDELLFAYDVLENWRASHGYPLHAITMNLRRHAKSVDSEATVIQRLKRLESIVGKLDRFPTLKMSQMQDIGGCRAIVASNKKAVELMGKLLSSRMKHDGPRLKDYIASPKPDGYRGIHMIYKFSATGEKSIYNGRAIEVQLRSKRQHEWATAVEAAGAITSQALKFNGGDSRWLRFFALMSGAIAHREKYPAVPGLPTGLPEIYSEIAHLENQLHVVHTLGAAQVVLKKVSGESEDVDFYLVRLRLSEKVVELRGFHIEHFREANEQYTELEKTVRESGSDDQVALVSSQNVRELSRAYPNYMLDTSKFRSLILEFCAASRESA